MNIRDGKPFTKVHAKPRISSEKSWAILGIGRKQFTAAKPWKKDGVSKEKYAELLNLFPPGVTRCPHGFLQPDS